VGEPHIQATQEASEPPVRLAASAFLLAAWVIGVVYCVARTVRRLLAARGLLRSADRATCEHLLAPYHEEIVRLGLRRGPRLCISRQVQGPLLAGLWRPSIVLPDNGDGRFSEAETRLMFAHELAHFQRRDLAWNWLPTVAGWLFFFHPLVWVASR